MKYMLTIGIYWRMSDFWYRLFAPTSSVLNALRRFPGVQSVRAGRIERYDPEGLVGFNVTVEYSGGVPTSALASQVSTFLRRQGYRVIVGNLVQPPPPYFPYGQ